MSKKPKARELSEEEVNEIDAIVDRLVGPKTPPDLPLLGQLRRAPSNGLPVLGGDAA